MVVRNSTFAGDVTTDKAFVSKGQNLSHAISAIKISQESTTKSQIRFYGANTSTPGSLEFVGTSSDASVGGARLTIDSSGNANFTGTIFASNNSPAYSFGSDTNTGIARTGTHQMSFLNNNSISLNLDAAARAQFYNAVTINGSSAPFTGSELDVRGDIVLIDQNWALRGNNSNADFCIEELGSSFSDANVKLVVKSGGNVGIGTTSPQEKLHIVNAAAASVNNFMLKLQNTTTVADSRTGILFSMNNSIGSARDGFAIQGVNNGVDGQGHLTFGSVLNNTFAEKMRILSGGNVGIGTTNPQSKLQVAGGIQMADDTATPSATKAGTMRYRTGTEDVETGGELISNGNNISAASWIIGASAWTFVNGQAVFGDTVNNAFYQSGLTLPSGNKFKLKFTVSNLTSGSANIYIGNSFGNADYIGTGYTNYANGTYEIVITMPSIQVSLAFWGGLSSGSTFNISNVSLIELVTEDASYADMCMRTGSSTYEWVNIVRNIY